MIKILETKNIKEFEKGPIRRSLFTNGAVSLFHEAKGFSGSIIQLHFIAGSIFEKENEEGIAHLIEHMLFKDGENSFVKELELRGAALNAYTYKENVCFEMSCIAQDLKELIPIFFKQFLTLEFSLKEFQKEKAVIQQELRDDLDDKESQAIETVFLRNFERPFGHPVGGQISKISKFSEKDVKKYFNKNFTSDRMIISVVSGKRMNNLENQLLDIMQKAKLNKIKKPFRLKTKNKITPLKHFKSTIKKKMENSLLVYSFDGPSLNSDFFYDYIVLDEILFTGLRSVMFKKLREDKPLVYAYGSSINCFSHFGNYLMIFNCQKSNLEKVKKACQEVFDDMCQGLLTLDEIESVKRRVLSSWEISFDNLEERAEFIAGSEIYELEEFSISIIKSKINHICSKRLQKVMNQIVKADYSELVLVPNS